MLKQIILANLLWPQIKMKKSFLEGWFLDDILLEKEKKAKFLFRNSRGEKFYIVLKKKAHHSSRALRSSKNFIFLPSRNSGRFEKVIKFFIDAVTQNDIADFVFFESPAFFKNNPVGIVLTLTYKCNLRCYFCFNSYDYDLAVRNKLTDFSTEKINEAIDRLYDNGIRVLILSGGEPLLRPDLLEIIKYAINKKIYVILNTNGTLFNEEKVKKFAQYPIHIMLSLHEFNDQESFETSGSRSLFTKRMQAVKLFRKYNFFFFEYATVLHKRNIENLEKVYSLLRTDLSPDSWQFYRLFDAQNTAGSSADEMIKAIDKMDECNAIYGVDCKIVDSLPFCVHPDVKKAARIISGEMHDTHLVKLVTDPSGNIKLMGAFQRDVGNIFTGSLKEMWNSDFSQKLLNLEMVPKICKRCFYLKDCCGGSRFLAYEKKGSYFARDPLLNSQNAKEFIK